MLVGKTVVYTGSNYKYTPVPSQDAQIQTHRYIQFYVQANNDAHVLLQSRKNDEVNGVYEIVIGGWRNSKSVIRDRKQGTNYALTHNMGLNSTSLRPFWVSFQNGWVKVGTGTEVGENQFMSWEDPTPAKIKFISVSTGFGSSGRWEFSK